MQYQDYVIRRNINHNHTLSRPRSLLSHIDIELTERCNNACLHCYINRPANDKYALRNELTTENWKNILTQAAELGAISVRFTGGEPLLRTDFEELYLFTRRLGLKVILFTNGRLINQKLADLFSHIPLLKKIEITAYGMHAESYESITCTSGSYSEYRNGINLLLEHEIPFIVKSVVLPPNQDELDEFEAWARTIPWMKDKRPSYVSFLDLRAKNDSPAKNKVIKNLRITPDQVIELYSRHELEFRDGMIQFCSKFIGPPGDHLFACGAGETGCVDAYGNYQMCMLLRHPDTIYDLKKGTIREALNEVFPKYRGIKATNPDYLMRCARCFLKGLCEQCPAKSWSEHGTLDTPVEYLCQVAHAQARFLGLLAENEWGWEIINWQDRVTALVQKYPPKGKINPASETHACEADAV